MHKNYRDVTNWAVFRRDLLAFEVKALDDQCTICAAWGEGQRSPLNEQLRSFVKNAALTDLTQFLQPSS